MIKRAPSILSADFAQLGTEVRKVAEAGADYIHIDVMDGTFVPQISLGQPVIRSMRQALSKGEGTPLFDVHLMVEHPETQIESIAAAGADIITFHYEAARHHHRIIQQIRAAGCKAGIVLNPCTSLACIEEILPYVDMVLLMTVNPGFGGQEFIEGMLEKIHLLHHTVEEMEFDCEIEVDGGINAETSKLVRQAGANVLVAGSAIYGATDVAQAIRDIRG